MCINNSKNNEHLLHYVRRCYMTDVTTKVDFFLSFSDFVHKISILVEPSRRLIDHRKYITNL